MALNLFQMDQARLYHDKLVNIKKTMLIVQEKTASLKVATTCMVTSPVCQIVVLANLFIISEAGVVKTSVVKR